MDNVGKNAIYKGYITKENFIKDFLNSYIRFSI